VDHRSIESLFVVVSPGLEEVCADELKRFGVTRLRTVAGGVEFNGRLEDIYQANLWLRTASRVLVRFDSSRCRAFPDLFRHTVRLPWGRFIRPETRVDVRVTCRRSRLMHSSRVAETIEKAIDKSLGRTQKPASGPTQMVLARLMDDELSLSIDSSGELLHRRGYRLGTARAPLRETLAAGILMLLGWDGSEPLFDPMCGTGSFILEGAMLAANRAPGMTRSFAFMNWPGFRHGLWTRLLSAAGDGQTSIGVALEGNDREAGAIAAAKENLQRLNISGLIMLGPCALAEQPVRQGPGLLVCNPPYGRRLKTSNSLQTFYLEVGKCLSVSFPGWRIALLCPEADLIRATRLPFTKIADLDNGGLAVGLYVAAN
jgi:putative N6-adenine-specific DNA methylase